MIPHLAWPAALALAVTLLLTPGGGSGLTLTAAARGGSGLTLTAAARDGSWSRSAVLACAPFPHGSHPLAVPACAALSAAGGDFDALPGQPGVCRDPYDPVIVTARGEFRGHPVRWRKKFANLCILRAATGPVFAFAPARAGASAAEQPRAGDGRAGQPRGTRLRTLPRPPRCRLAPSGGNGGRGPAGPGKTDAQVPDNRDLESEAVSCRFSGRSLRA